MSEHSLSAPDRQPLKSAALACAALLMTTLLLWFISSGLQGSDLAFLLNPLDWLRGLDNATAIETLGNAAEVVAAVLAIAITVVAIIVELAANRYSHLITRLFIREPVNFFVLGLFVITTIQCVWSAGTTVPSSADALVPHAGFALTMGLVTLSLLALLPYIYYVFTFLSPISVIRRISYSAFEAMNDVRAGSVEPVKVRVQAAIDELQDVARGAVVQGDRSIAMAGVNALCDLVHDYAGIKSRMPDAWFRVSGSVTADADFIALADNSLQKIEADRIWLETKVFRQLFALMTLCAGHARQVANLISIDTTRLTIELGDRDTHLLALCMRTINSYLRATINARDARTAYYVMNQYRQVAEHLLQSGRVAQGLEIAGYLREYGQLAHKMNLSFLLEAAAYDVMQLIEFALRYQDASVDRLLDVLLELDLEIKEERLEDSLLGVRRSQLIIAAKLKEQGAQARFERVVADLRQERLERLERLRDGLLTDEREDYWELMDRGSNFGYLAPELRPYLLDTFRAISG